MEKVKKVKGSENAENAILYRVVCKRLSDKIEFKQRPEASKGAGHIDM